MPLYQRLRDEFSDKIASGAWPVDASLPSETELAELHNVAVGTIRKALDSLVAEGVLIRAQGKGTFIRRASFDASLFRFFRYETSEGNRRVPKARILERRLLPAPRSVAAVLKIDTGTHAIRLDRLRFIDSVPILSEEIWLPSDRFTPLATLPAAEFGHLLYPLYEKTCGQIVASATESLFVTLADPSDQTTLGVPPGAPVVVIERIAFDCARMPIEWRRSRGPAANFHYRIDIR